MELLIDGVLKVLDDEGDHDFDILTGKVCETTARGRPLPSGKHTKNYWKWQFLPIENGDFL